MLVLKTLLAFSTLWTIVVAALSLRFISKHADVLINQSMLAAFLYRSHFTAMRVAAAVAVVLWLATAALAIAAATS